MLTTLRRKQNMTLKPLFDKVVLKKVEAEETTKVGIILTGSAKEKPDMSEVVAVGPGGIIDGDRKSTRLNSSHAT